MVLCSSVLQMKPPVLTHLCLLLLIFSSSLLMSTVESGAVDPRVQFDTTKANCSFECNITVNKVATAEDTTKNISTEVVNTQNHSVTPGFNAAPASTFAKQALNSTFELQTKSDSTKQLQSSSYTHSSLSHTTIDSVTSLTPHEHSSIAPSATQQPAPTSHQPVFTTTGLSTPFAHTEPSMSPAPSTTVPPVTNTHKQTTLTPEISPVATPPKYTTPTETTSANIPTEALTHPLTTTISKSTGTKMSPSLDVTSLLSTRKPAIQATSSNTDTAASFIRNTSSASHRKSSASATRVSMVEAAGGALTRQLVDTASLMAVLLFGLLFFLVTVAVFITQAYESYRRKDYTQVDYLINGMYIDSGV